MVPGMAPAQAAVSVLDAILGAVVASRTGENPA